MERYKLLIETVDNQSIDTLIESNSTTKEKEYKIRGPFIMTEQVNKNGRKYPMPVVEPEVDRYRKEKISTMCAYGNADHPEGNPTLKLMDAALITTALIKDGNNFIGEAKILSTPSGRVLRNLMEDGCRLAVSTRGLGSLSNGIVSSNFKLIGTDAVADPSAHIAVVESIVENFDYIIQGDKFVAVAVDRFKEDLSKHGSKKLAEDLGNFISKLRSM
jgi:hypothetical protein